MAGRGNVGPFQELENQKEGVRRFHLVRFPNPLAFGSDFPKSGGDPV